VVVDPASNPAYLRSVAQAVARFRQAFEAFLNLHVENTTMARGIAPAVIPRAEADPAEISKLENQVAEAAGAAGDAVSLTNSYMMVQGMGAPLDAIANWQTVTRPKPLLEAKDVLGVCSLAMGRLDSLIRKADASSSEAPQLGPAALHATVWDAAARYWTMHLFRDAVRVACEALVARVKGINGHNELADTDAWTQIFSDQSPTPSRPRLRWPGSPTDLEVRTMNAGLGRLAPGLQMTIRNPSTHGLEDFTEQEAFEQLAALSMLSRWMDRCEVVKAEDQT